MNEFNKIEMTTMVKVTNNLTKEGYTENFVPHAKGILAPSNDKVYTPDQVRINSFYRFEGVSDPADNGVMYAIETADGLKGILVDAYGAYANSHISKFISEVEEIGKKAHTHDPVPPGTSDTVEETVEQSMEEEIDVEIDEEINV